MFTKEFRDHVLQRVLKADPRVTGGAITGSTALGADDMWSDIDFAFGIADGNRLEAVPDDLTQALDQEFNLVTHVDLRAGQSRVFLLPNGLEIDISVKPAEEFGAFGPKFRTLFGTPHQLKAMLQPEASSLIELGWLSVLHARASIERNSPWKTEFWISGIRDQIIALACLRLGENAIYGSGVERLPASVTNPLAGALVRSLDTSELRRALAVATLLFIGELELCDKQICARLSPLLREFGIPNPDV